MIICSCRNISDNEDDSLEKVLQNNGKCYTCMRSVDALSELLFAKGLPIRISLKDGVFYSVIHKSGKVLYKTNSIEGLQGFVAGYLNAY